MLEPGGKNLFVIVSHDIFKPLAYAGRIVITKLEEACMHDLLKHIMCS